LIGSMTVAACACLVAVGAADAGDPGGNGKPTWEALVACLNSHGVQTPATSDPAELKAWIGEHYDSDPAVKAALEACAPDASKDDGGDSGPSLADVVSCLRSHGAQPPDTSDPLTLKTWLGQHESDPAVESALQACAPSDKKDTASAPSLTQLKACLVRAGIDVPDDVDLKQWLGRVVDQARVKQALRGCGVTVARKRTHSKNGKVTLRLVVARR
jgi:hypothetical protein